MKFTREIRVSGIGAVKAYDRKCFIFDPDASRETPLAGFFRRRYIKNQCANFAQELAPHVIEIVIPRIQAIGIGINHLKKALRQILDSNIEKSVHIGDGLTHRIVFSRLDRFEVQSSGKIRAPYKVAVAGRLPAFLVRLHMADSLDIRFDQRRILADDFHFLIFTGDNLGHNLTERAWRSLILRRKRRCAECQSQNGTY